MEWLAKPFNVREVGKKKGRALLIGWVNRKDNEGEYRRKEEESVLRARQ